MKKTISIVLCLVILFLNSYQLKTSEELINKEWWKNEVNVATWVLFNPGAVNKNMMDYMRDLNITILDRGAFYGAYPDNTTYGGWLADWIHGKGFKYTAFQTIAFWNPADIDQYIAKFKTQVDDNCNGLHLDMLGWPLGGTEIDAPEAYEKLLRELKEYAITTKGSDFMISGNVWTLDTAVRIRLGGVSDVIWAETPLNFNLYLNAEKDLIRTSRLGRAAGMQKKPVWIHWGPDTNTHSRVASKANMVKAMIGSALFENSIYMSNYVYCILDSTDNKWKDIVVSEGWQAATKQYNSYINKYSKYYATDIQPESNILFAFTPNDVNTPIANQILTEMISKNISANVELYGIHPFQSTIEAQNLQKYKIVFSMEALDQVPAGVTNIVVRSLAEYKTEIAKIQDVANSFLKITGSPYVIGRVMNVGSEKILHLKNNTYRDSSDSNTISENIHISLYAPNIKSAKLVSPDQNEIIDLKLSIKGQNIEFTVPKVDYYSMVILSTSEPESAISINSVNNSSSNSISEYNSQGSQSSSMSSSSSIETSSDNSASSASSIIESTVMYNSMESTNITSTMQDSSIGTTSEIDNHKMPSGTKYLIALFAFIAMALGSIIIFRLVKRANR